MQIFHGKNIIISSKPDHDTVVVENGIIIDTGKFEILKDKYKNAPVTELNNSCLVPGFIDGHSHLTATAYTGLFANLNPPPVGECNSVESLVNIMRRQLKNGNYNENKFLVGFGYDNSVFQANKHPSEDTLNQISSEIPIAVVHVSGHICALNSRGMKVLNVFGNILDETEFFSVAPRISSVSEEDVLSAIKNTALKYASYGITTAQDAKISKNDFNTLCKADKLGLVPIDVCCYADTQNFSDITGGTKRVSLKGCKLFLDGSPQGKTAWLTKPYEIAPDGKPADYCGESVMDDESLIKIMSICIEKNIQFNVHANGDAAIDQFIRCYEKSGTPETKVNQRPVIIHCQTVRNDQLLKIKENNILVSYFADHVYYWGDYHVESVLGWERAKRISPLRSTADLNIPFTIHTDSPVVPPDMVFSIHNAVNRTTKSGLILGTEQTISVKQALDSVTVNGAYQIFEDKEKGSIKIGQKADFAVLDTNPLNVVKEKLKDIKVLSTYKEGQMIYNADCKLLQ